VLITGRFEADEDSAKILCSEIQPLVGIAERNARLLCIRVPIGNLGPNVASNLYRLLEENRGETGVELELYQPDDFRVTIKSADFVRVKSGPELIRRIEGICGSGCVYVMN
jgi:hypothetical protein